MVVTRILDLPPETTTLAVQLRFADEHREISLNVVTRPRAPDGKGTLEPEPWTAPPLPLGFSEECPTWRFLTVKRTEAVPFMVDVWRLQDNELQQRRCSAARTCRCSPMIR